VKEGAFRLELHTYPVTMAAQKPFKLIFVMAGLVPAIYALLY
jgi:hypothetical protein